MPLNFALACVISCFGIQQYNAKGNTDHGELVVGVATSIVYIELIRDAIGLNGLL